MNNKSIKIGIITTLIIVLGFFIAKLMLAGKFLPAFCILGVILLAFFIFEFTQSGLKEGFQIIGIVILLTIICELIIYGTYYLVYHFELNNPIIYSLIAAIPLFVSQIITNTVDKKTKRYSIFIIIMLISYSFIFVQFIISLVNITISYVEKASGGDAEIWAVMGSKMINISKIFPAIFYALYIFISFGPLTKKLKKLSNKIVNKTREVVFDNHICVVMSEHKKYQNNFKEIDDHVIDAGIWTHFFTFMIVVESFVLGFFILQILVSGFYWNLLAYNFSASLFYTAIFVVFYFLGYLCFLKKRKEIEDLLPDIKKFQEENPDFKLAVKGLLKYNDMINLYTGLGLPRKNDNDLIRITVRLSPDLIVLAYTRAGALLKKEIDKLKLEVYTSIQEMEETDKPQTYQIFIDDKLQKEGSIIETLTNKEKVEIIINDYKKAYEEYKENNKSIKIRLMELEESLKKDIPALPKISINNAFRFKPYEYECNYNGEELMHGNLLEEEEKLHDADKLKNMSEEELNNELTNRLLEKLRQAIINTELTS